MKVDDLFGVVHTAVTDFNGIPVENFMKAVVPGEVFVYKAKESLSDVGAGIFAKWGVVPKYVASLSVSAFCGRSWFVV